VIELAPEQADGYAGLAKAYVRLAKRAEEAVKLAQTAVKLDSAAPNYFVLATACERARDRAGAESALEEAIRLDPDKSEYQDARARLREGRSP
jgi:cytochrome c-type biogenesis protein CcmH/NrfG